jgi:DNA-binding MarR family transcriptional regulator
MTDDLAAADYTALAAFHEQLHRTIDTTTTKARQAGLQPATFLVLLALRRQPADAPLTIGELAKSLQWNRTELADLVEDLVGRGFVARRRDANDRRRFLVSLTAAGEHWLRPLAKDVLNELAASGPDLLRIIRVAVSHAAASAARAQPQARADISSFAWRAVGSAPI